MAGRPLLFQSEQELQDKITEYLTDYCGLDEYGNISSTVKFKMVPTVTGLALYLGTSRETLMNYEKKEQFFDTIKKAKDMILSFNESALYSKKINTAGVIFNLKNNYGWRDRVETLNLNTDVDEVIDKEDITTFINGWLPAIEKARQPKPDVESETITGTEETE